MALDISGMADGIQDELWSRLDPGDPAKRPTKAELRDISESIATGVINHIVANMEIKGVTVALDTGPRTIETYVAGAGSNGGALASVTGGPVSGNVADSKADSGTQSNDGTGRVS